ncbi:MAG: hypothetical protein HOI53_06985 [Francisellaceae bacterium]|mgnify:FL=1|jgi:K+-sensing histidine kinase KdpD|nr:hypothetical protein [Francisellaceae bacterium]MBT6207756.1 hypothetical protein [Francisellaceae bacterium]MBT6538056.1 hypothetical protein [Francisellaceae bacterium]
MTENNGDSIHATIIAAKVHDCKNIIGTSLSTLEHLLSKYPNEPKIQNLGRGIHLLNQYITDVLYHHRIQTDEMYLNYTSNYISDTIEEQINNSCCIKGGENLQFITDCPQDLEWEYDELLIGIVLRNLYINAVEFAVNEINTRVYLENKSLIIEIADDGPGLTDHTKTIGSGLHLCRELLKVHNKGEKQTLFVSNKLNSIGAQIKLIL